MKKIYVENFKKVNINNWSEFIVGEFFSISRGQRQKAEDRTKGDIPYYSASNDNNGMTDKIGNPKFIDNDTIIGTTFGDFYYVEGDFSGSDEITIYHHPKIDGNKYIGLYLVSILKKNKHKYSFKTKMFTNNAKKDVIYLPVDANNNPDWLYMENYMRNIENKVKKSLHKFLYLTNNFNKVQIDTNNWVDFLVSDVFYTNKTGKKINVPTGGNVNKKDLKKGLIPRISVTGVNNGVLDYFEDLPNNPNYRTYENFISVSFLGTVFYQQNKSSIDMKVHCLKPIKHSLNKNTGRFLVTAIIASLKNTSYSDQISSSSLATLKIKLPSNENGEPDWSYMEDYIIKLEIKLKESLFAIMK